MGITSSALPSFAFCKNPINVELTSDDYIQSFAVSAIIKVSFLGAIATGKQTRLVWSTGDITLTARNVPDESGFQYPAGDGGVSHVESVIEAWRSNYYIDRDFTLSLAGTNDAIFFTAKKPGVLYNIAPVADAQLAVTVDTVGENQALKPNFAHHLEVWLTGNGDDQKIYDENLQLEPGTGKTVKDISGILSPYLAPNVVAGSDKPDLSLTTWQACSNTICRYYIKFAQYFGDVPVVNKVHTSAPAIVNYGGLDVQAALNNTMIGYLQPGGLGSTTLCLRQGGKNKKVTTAQPEWLYWINFTNTVVSVKLRIDIFYTDGTSSYYTLAPFNAAAAGAKYYVPVSYKALAIARNASAGKNISYYSVRVCDAADNFLSAAYNYTIDGFRAWPRYFVYLNSLGGFQTLYTWGKGQPETDITKEDIYLQTNYTQAATIGSQKENNQRLQRKGTVYTGYRTLREIRLLNDFLISPEKYLVDNGRLIPIGTTTDSLKEPQDGSNLNGAAFTYEYLYDEVVYTDDNTAPEATPGNPGSGVGGTPQGFNAIVDDGNNTDNLYYQDI